MSRKQLFFFVGTIVLLLIGRFMLAGTGYLDDQDELLYLWMSDHFQESTQLSFWVGGVTQMQGQPPEMIIRALEYWSLLPVAHALGKQPLHPDVLYFVGLYNILVSVLILYVFFCICRKLLFSVEHAILGMFLLGTLVNFNIYTRHILPYDHALLIHLLALNLLLRKEANLRDVLLAGSLSAIALTWYMGEFVFVVINGSFLIFSSWNNRSRLWKKLFLFGGPFVLLVLIYELCMQWEGKSYLGFIANYSTTVYMASFDEGFTYFFIYFWQVEKWWGMLLVVIAFFGITRTVFNRQAIPNVKALLSIAILAYIAYGAYVYFGHKMVFHGRILHIYFPFVIIGVLVMLQQLKGGLASISIPLLFIGALVNYYFIIQDFKQIGYPRNFIYQNQLFSQQGKVELECYEEMASPVHYCDRASWRIDSIGSTNLDSGKYILSNICFNIHYPDSEIIEYPAYRLQSGDTCIKDQLHFQSHPAYVFEYCDRGGRALYIKKQLKLKVIKRQSSI